MLPCLLILKPSEVPKYGIHFNTLGEIQPIVQAVLLMVKCSSECTGLLQGDDLHPEEDQCTLVKSKHGQGFSARSSSWCKRTLYRSCNSQLQSPHFKVIYYLGLIMRHQLL